MTAVLVLLAAVLVVQILSFAVLGRTVKALVAKLGAPPPPSAAPLAAPPALDGEPDAVMLRPDPSAQYNVFRVVGGAPALTDPQRYSGNDERLARQAIESYRATYWPGRVFVFRWVQCLDEFSA